jgi:uncharacterized protein (TIGR00303 family)
MSDILSIGDSESCSRFLSNIISKKPLILTVIGNTETGKIPGISAAGANPEITDFTPAADMEYLYYNLCKCIPGIPVTPDGIPTPGIITKAALELSNFPNLVVVGGARILPDVPFIHLGGEGGLDISKGLAVKNAKKIFDNAKIFGEKMAQIVEYLVIGESIAGGTTTALGALIALGLDGYHKVSSSLPLNPSDLKKSVVLKGLEAAKIKPGDFKTDPLGAIEKLGDPMQAATLGIIAGVNSRIPILLAGGTQMAAVAALANALNPSLVSNIAIGTTKWIVNDSKSDIKGIIKEINPSIPIFAANFDFSSMTHPGLQIYEQGIVKEGVGAGGVSIAAILASNNKLTIREIQERIQANYNRLMKIQ